ncbi:ATP-binding protein [Lactiplantibacillus sp. WILCCON 0030]|uniref:ATP-binding protein n=1 Tax=Lactiplantibacillus brownii TaxID=3069269 RepID=A0ABU1A7V6_9LACO|nr:ATP-binding protein [Lactiplantibacillus brownii]MDQ7937016.1 ATP-binding protein [Lactiplantibacillus brownii]
METGKRLRKLQTSNTIVSQRQRLLKSVLVFGANANGKTNLIKALLMLKRLVINPTTDELQHLNTDTFGYNKENSKFEISFIANEQQYDYLLEYNSDEVVHEKLVTAGQVIFNRQKQNFVTIPTQLRALTENVRKNQLLLYFAQQNNEKFAKAVYKWFVEDLIIVSTDRIKNEQFKMLQDESFKTRFLHFLQAADFNIVDVEVKERDEKIPIPAFLLKQLNSESETDEEIKYMHSVSYDVYATHQAENGSFSVYFNNESTGTQVFMFLALYMLSNSEKTLMIDEFDRSYHLELAQALLRLINNAHQTNQFILTTHELSLLDAGLRQDQIWFAEKNRFGESELFSIFDFDDPALKRSDFNYKKRYLEGVYGATQLVNNKLLLEALIGNEQREAK